MKKELGENTEEQTGKQTKEDNDAGKLKQDRRTKSSKIIKGTSNILKREILPGSRTVAQRTKWVKAWIRKECTLSGKCWLPKWIPEKEFRALKVWARRALSSN